MTNITMFRGCPTLRMGEVVIDKTDPRHLGQVVGIINSVWVQVRWIDRPKFESTIHWSNLRRAEYV